MTPVVPLSAEIESRLRAAMTGTLPAGHAGSDPQVRRSDRADFQANGLFAVAKKAGVNPREIAEKVVASLSTGDLLALCEVSGPGFLNITVTDAALLQRVAARLADARLGIPTS